jgi:hypothetical protein
MWFVQICRLLLLIIARMHIFLIPTSVNDILVRIRALVLEGPCHPAQMALSMHWSPTSSGFGPWLVSSRTAAGLLKLSDTAIKLEERGNLGDVVSLLTDIAEAAVDPVAEQ